MVYRAVDFMRGLLAFAAFVDFGTTVRCFIDPESIIGEFSNGLIAQAHQALSRLLGFLCLLNAIIMVQCAINVDNATVMGVGVCFLLVKIVVFCLEIVYYHTIPTSFVVVFPIGVSAVALVGLFLAPTFCKMKPVTDDENDDLLRQRSLPPYLRKRLRAKKAQ